ncbi:MAG: preprotein translocase subunit YajC [Kiloniellales bacterium]|nr:preprotein translocase subunit YajC [Kiloniellales bacterium]
MLISPAYAQGAAAAPDPFMTFVPLILIGVVFYFLLIRPQQKRIKDHRAMVQALRRGDKVVTAGGVFGTVTKVVSDSELQVEIAENVRIRVVRSTISEVLQKAEPANRNEQGGGEGAQTQEPAKKGGFKLFGGGKSG